MWSFHQYSIIMLLALRQMWRILKDIEQNTGTKPQWTHNKHDRYK